MQIHHFLLPKWQGHQREQYSPKLQHYTQSCHKLHHPQKYLAVIYPFPANIGVHITRSAINAPVIIINSPNDNNVTGYGHTNYKPITSLPIFGGAFLDLLPCSIVLSNKKIQTHYPHPCHHQRRAQ